MSYSHNVLGKDEETNARRFLEQNHFKGAFEMSDDHEFTRRGFLQTAAAVAAVSALPGLGAPTILSSPGPNEQVRYGFIGTGTQGCALLEFLTTIPEGRCVATCDIYPPNLKKGVEIIGTNPATYEDYRQLLDRKDIDAVMIATPLHLHGRMILDGLSAGKHVFVEKSMFFKEEEAEPIRQAAAAHPNQVVQIGLHRRSSVLYQVATEMVRKGALGKVMFVESCVDDNSTWRRPVAEAKYERLINWRMYREYSGGLMAEMGSHFIDVANWVLGTEPVSVIGMGGIDYWKDGRETHDNVQAIFEYPGGKKLYFNSILFNGHNQFGVLVMGDQGTLDINDDRAIYFREPVAKVSSGPAKESWWAGATVSKTAAQKGILVFPERGGGSKGFLERELQYARRWLASLGIYEYREPFNPYWGELVSFFASVREGKPTIVPVGVGMADALAVIYANRAIDTGQKVFWPPEHARQGPKAGCIGINQVDCGTDMSSKRESGA